MWWIVLCLLVILAIFVLSFYTPVHSLPVYLSAPLVISVYIPLSIIVLVPADVVQGGLGIGEHARMVLWRIIYWASFVLTWLILPSLQFYVESGYHDPIVKIKDALKSNIKHQLILAAIGVVGLLYMGASTGSLTNLKALAIALSYSYSLVLCIWLLGHGLISVPRDLWNSLPGPRLTILYSRAQAVCDNYSDALSNYHDAASRIIALIPIKTPQYSEWIDELVEDVRASSLGYPTNSRQSIPSGDLDDTLLASLSQRVVKERARAIRYRADWIRLLEECAFCQDIQAGNEFRYFTSKLPREYFSKVRPWIVRVGAVVLAATSAIIVQSELFMGSRFSLADIVIDSCGGVLQVLATMALLGYMCLVTGRALSSVRVFNLYGLVPRHSDPSSLIFYAMYACRLAVPLSFNFLTLVSKHNSSVFQEFLGQYINLTPLGKYFNDLLPRLIVVFMALTWFEFYRAVQDYFGFLGDDVESRGDGHALVERALNDSRFTFSLEQTKIDV